MRNLLSIILLMVFGILNKAQSQNSFESDMKEAIAYFERAATDEEKMEVIEKFEQLTTVNPDQWLPLYYAVYSTTLNAFQMADGMEKTDSLLEIIPQLEALGAEKSEILVLEALIKTIKISKDPMTYGMSLSREIPYLYVEANEINPENPRPYYLLAQFNINASGFMGGNPEESCPMLEKALILFEKEDKDNILPHWGEPQAKVIYEDNCK